MCRMKVSWVLISVYLYLQYEQNQCDWSNSCSWFLLSEIGVGSKISALLIKLISKINRRSKTTTAPSFSFHPYQITMLSTLKNALPSLIRLRRVPIELRASRIHYSVIPQQSQNDTSSLTTQIDLGVDTMPNQRSLLAYNKERQFEAYLTYRLGTDDSKYDPKKLDITLGDLDHSLLEHEISEALGRPYLSEVEVHPHANDVDGPQVFIGIFWDCAKSRPMVTLPVSYCKYVSDEPRQDRPMTGKLVHFLVCPTSPYSFISREVSQEDS